MKTLDDMLTASNLVGVLSRSVAVRFLDISAAGCLLEASSRVQEGLVGAVVVTLDGEEYADDARIIRCGYVPGAAVPYRIGVQFLWTTLPRERSLRMVLSRLASRRDAASPLRLADWHAT